MKGYSVPYGYIGYIESDHKYILFASEADYIEYIS